VGVVHGGDWRGAAVSAEGQAALRLAVITEVREAASCGSGDGDQCPKCTRHADAILAAVAAQEPKAAPGDAERLAIAMAALRQIHQDGDDYSAQSTAEEALSDIADLSPRLRPELRPAPGLPAATVLAEVLDFLGNGIPPGDEFALQVAQWRKRGLAS